MATPTRRAQGRDAAGALQKRKALPKVATGIAGLDKVLGGGLPAGRMTLLSGGAGSGKSMMGLQCLLQGAGTGEPGILVMFEERAAAVRQNAWSLGWDLAPLEKKNRIYLMDARLDPEAVISGDFSIRGLLAILDQRIKAMRARRIMIDAVDALLHLYDSPLRERHEINTLHEWLLDRGLTTIMTVKTIPQEEAPSRYAFLDFMADCVIHVDQRVTAQVTTRRLRVIKYRGSGYGRNEYPFIISGDGITVIPITSVAIQHRPLGPKVSSGQSQLDDVLAGGYKRGASVLIVGTAGAGKTTLACMFALATCRRGERVLYLNFEESPESMVGSMLSPGLGLRPLIKSGTLVVRSYLPEAMGVEEHLFHALKALDEFQPQHVVVDSISACQRMGSEGAAFEYLMRLMNACKERGITCLYISQATGLDIVTEISGIGISSITDTIVLLRHVPIGGVMKRELIVMKSRGSKHSEQFHEFRITDRGIDLGKA
ncbi:MAG TPA: circadian clock protein KaiC [Candidatus Acidoferrum sp.]|nr:circadian clock protein KaiC [Candidatus Acidoferrum sp.]